MKCNSGKRIDEATKYATELCDYLLNECRKYPDVPEAKAFLKLCEEWSKVDRQGNRKHRRKELRDKK